MFQIIRIYDDFTSMNETTKYITDAFASIAIYLEDPHCVGIKIVDLEKGLVITNYWANYFAQLILC